jgi:transcriptional regulator with XRE-family HTH domain
MTIRDLAAATGLTATAISNLETDKCKAQITTLRKFAKILDVPVSYLGCFEKLPEHTLGQRITKARLFHGLTKKELAIRLGVDPKTLRHWEQDKHEPFQRYLNALELYMEILKNN